MLAGIMANIRGVRPIKWRNRYGEFETYQEAIARFRQLQPQTVAVALPSNQRSSDDEALLFILANL